MTSKSRRSFLSNLGAAASAAGVTLAAGSASAQAPASGDAHWQPARHPQDDWFDQLPGKHRFYFDSTTPDRLEDAIQFTGNYFSANRGVYGLENADLAVIVGMRHRSAPFAFNDAIWAKYGVTLAGARSSSIPRPGKRPR